MRFLYYYRMPLPDARADAVQIINTCAGIAGAGADVALHVETLSDGTAECLRWYGLEPPAGDGSGSLRIEALGTHWSWPLFGWKTGRALRESGPGTCLFVREVRPYVPGLMRRARDAGLKIIFEAHNVSASLVLEKQAKVSRGAALPLVGEGAPSASSPEAPADAEGAEPLPAADAGNAAARRLRRKAEQRATLERTIVGAVDGLICTQKATFDALEPLLRKGAPATVLGNGTRMPPERPGGEKDIDILYCGSLKPWKGVDLLVAAMQTLYPHRLTIVGPGPKEDVARLQKAALAVGALERIRILPPVRPTEVWELYARARVGVIPLPGENYIEARDFTSPLKLFEMMAAGLPIVASRLRSIGEYVTDGREALLVPADDPRALAQALRRLLEDETLRGDLASAARARAAEFTWDKRGQKIVTFAGELLG